MLGGQTDKGRGTMRLLIIRHGDPDYVHDSLTSEGRTEAMLLAAYLKDVPIDYAYVSPLGRAQETAQPTLNAKRLTATTLDWLQEFRPKVKHKASYLSPACAWDWLPEDWTEQDIFYTDHWYNHPAMVEAGVREEYQAVCDSFDQLLASHGYERTGRIYNVTQANHDTLALFCHYGLCCVLLSRLLSVSPMVLWHGLCAAPSSITTVYSEERRRGKASFRVREYGGIEHLAMGHTDPSFAARFCECFTDLSRH